MTASQVEEVHIEFAKFMAGVYAYVLEAKNSYDPLRIFLSSKIDPLPYQIYDFAKLMEELSTHGNIRALIAYETGLGKTILAGMLMQELIAVHGQRRNARVLVLTPPGVILQFREELSKKFGLDLDIFDSSTGKFSDQTIASIDTVKFDQWKEELRDQEWDLVLVDELHRASPGNMRGELLELITERTKHFVALTATPHDGKSERYYYRLSLTAPSPIVIRRTKRESVDVNNAPLFGQKVIETTEDFEVDPLELQFYDAADKYARDRFKSAGAGALVAVVMGRAISSSIRAGVKMLARRRARLMNPGPEADPEVVRDAYEHLQDGGELSDSEIDTLFSSEPISPEERENELQLLEPVLELGRQILAQEDLDRKGQFLLTHLKDWIGEDRKVLIFTSFLETVDYLCEILEDAGYRPKKITSRVAFDERKQVVRSLDEDERVRIIVGTDAMSESLNLQSASVEINYEVPWSPVAYIQRVGRIWRLKQKRDPLYIHNFLPAFKVEQRVMEVMLEKIQTINDEFGEVGLSVFAQQLGDIEELIHKEGETIASTRIEDAFKMSRKISKEVVDILNSSKTLPRVVNVEELQKSAYIDLDETLTEGDLYRFLEYLKEVPPYGSGQLPHKDSEVSTYQVFKDGRYILVDSLSLRDQGVQTAIDVAKDLIEDNRGVRLAYHKNMRGTLELYSIKVDDKTVYEEPVLVTPDGILTFEAILSLVPYYVEQQTRVSFIPREDYIAKRKEEWLGRSLYLWAEKRDDIQKELIMTDNRERQARYRQLLQEHLSQKPAEARVEQKATICEVEFEQTESEQSWLERHEVEQKAMKAAMEYFESLGYQVEDIARDNRGYDIICRKHIQILRVEVKGIQYHDTPTLTENERNHALEYGDGFALFILRIEKDRDRRFVIYSPIGKITMTPHQKTVYSVSGYTQFEIG